MKRIGVNSLLKIFLQEFQRLIEPGHIIFYNKKVIPTGKTLYWYSVGIVADLF